MKKIKIIAVEDDSLVAIDLKNKLEKIGYNVCGVYPNGRQAIKSIETNTPDLILMDIGIQGDIDGVETAEIIHEKYNLPIIYLTAYSDDATIKRVGFTPQCGYILKPYTQQSLRVNIETGLNRFRNKMEIEKNRNDLKNLVQGQNILFEIAKKISAEIEIDKLLKSATETIQKAFGFYGVMIFLVDECTEESCLIMQTIAGGYENIFFKGFVIKIGEGMIGKAAQTKKTQFSNDVSKNPDYIRKREEIAKSEIAIPLLYRNKVIGVLDVQSRKKDAYKELDGILMETISSQIAVAIVNATLYKKLQIELKEKSKAQRDINMANEQLEGMVEKTNAFARRMEFKNLEHEIIFNTTAEGMLIVKKDFNISLVNNAVVELVGKPKNKITKKKCFEIFPNELCGTDKCTLKQIYSGKTHVEQEILFTYKSGKQIPCLLTANRFIGVSGKTLGFVSSIKNMTRRKELERKLLQSQKLESIGQLAAGIAHEINTPTQYVGDNVHFMQEYFQGFLKIISHYDRMINSATPRSISQNLFDRLEELKEETDFEFGKEEIPKAIEQAIEGIDRVAKIVRAMKEFSHPEQKDKTPMNLKQTIQTTITVAKNEWKYVAEMKTDFDKDLPEVDLLPDEFNQVVLNLILNAVDAIKEKLEQGNHNEKGVITISTGMKDNFAIIKVEDNGNGIPKNVLTKIYDPFFTTKEVGQGTGQGLSICRDIIVNKHNGSIDVESKVGEGTKFTIRIPIKQTVENHDDLIDL